MVKEVRLYNVYYNYDNSMSYETTTDNFDKWLDQHNQQRVNDLACGSQDDYQHENKECICYESEDMFEVKEASIVLFGGKNGKRGGQ